MWKAVETFSNRSDFRDVVPALVDTNAVCPFRRAILIQGPEDFKRLKAKGNDD